MASQESDTNNIEYKDLIPKFDSYIPQIYGRLMQPDKKKSLFSLGFAPPTGLPNDDCLSKLHNLRLFIIWRQLVKDYPYESTEHSKLHMILKDKITYNNTFIFPKHLLTVVSPNNKICVHFALKALEELNNTVACSGHERINNFLIDKIDGVNGTLKLNKWQQKARDYIASLTPATLSQQDERIKETRYTKTKDTLTNNGIPLSIAIDWLAPIQPKAPLSTSGGGGGGGSNASVSGPVMGGGARRNRRARKTLKGSHKVHKARKTNKSRRHQ
jgi:hypothetical protein